MLTEKGNRTMRLIDADALIKCYANSSMSEAAKDIAKTMPTVDAVEVVRCGQCKFFRTAKCTSREDGWYCADGQRRENDVSD